MRRGGTTFMFPERQSRNHGFTLLEMGLVLFIILVLAGITIPFASGLITEERLRGSTRDLQLLARTARRLAVSENRPYQIELAAGGFALEPYPAVEKEALKTFQLAADVEYTIQRWGDKELRKPEAEPWIFQPTGLCEPLHFHFRRGAGWIEFTFNPLTAAAQDESNYFP
jgi:prepilin-type N-terminal cleavage/methylation domain-containing protein